MNDTPDHPVTEAPADKALISNTEESKTTPSNINNPSADVPESTLTKEGTDIMPVKDEDKKEITKPELSGTGDASVCESGNKTDNETQRVSKDHTEPPHSGDNEDTEADKDETPTEAGDGVLKTEEAGDSVIKSKEAGDAGEEPQAEDSKPLEPQVEAPVKKGRGRPRGKSTPKKPTTSPKKSVQCKFNASVVTTLCRENDARSSL